MAYAIVANLDYKLSQRVAFSMLIAQLQQGW
jgi:hypothetical protein